MALSPTRFEYRIELHHVDAGLERAEAVIAMLHPSETLERLTLRVLAWCLFQRDGLAFGPGLSEPGAADLLARDLTGRITAWIEVGSAKPDEIKRVVQHNPGAEVPVLFSDPRRRAELEAGLEGWKHAAKVQRWTVERTLVDALAAREQRRHKWSVTVVGDCFYVEADGESLSGALTR